jgi:DNA-3-methyladenine glycosylase II
MSKDQVKHLRKDKILAKAIREIGEIKTSKNYDLYFSLMRAVVGQQLSVKAANTIWGRFLALFKSGYPDAKSMTRINVEKLRDVGLSYQKAGYIKNIAKFSIEKTLDYKKLKDLSDEELIEYLVQIKGVGRWTVEMILMFNLNRLNIFPKDDLGIQNGMKRLYLIEEKNKKELYSRMNEVAKAWEPYRTLACLYIWRYKDTAPL